MSTMALLAGTVPLSRGRAVHRRERSEGARLGLRTAHCVRVRVRVRATGAAEGNPEWAKQMAERDELVNTQLTGVQNDVQERLRFLLKPQPTAASPGASNHDGVAELRKQIVAAQSVLSEGLVERETEVRLLLLAAVCGEHLLLLGPPGTAKSELGRRLSKLCKGTYFERLLTRFSVPEELFGPLSLRALEQDQYVRQIKGYLPDANVAFLDEVFKANSAVLNSLLTILNERLFDNGSERLPVPLLCLVGASNELPESEELDALYDRFLFRHAVSQVSEAGLSDLLQIASHAPTGRAALTSAALELNAEAMAAVRERAYAEVALPAEIIDLLGELRTYLQQDCEPPVYVSDRRLVKAVAMLRVSAYTCGRRAVNEFDVLLLEHVLWQRPEEAERIRDWLLQRVCKDRGTKQVQYLLSGLFGRACRADGKEPECAALATEAARLRTALIAQLQASGDVAGSGELQSHAWISGTSAQRAAQTLGPLMSQMRKSQEKLLTEVVTLECALESRTEPHVLALLLPELWGRFIRTGSLEDVRPLGTQPDKSLVQQQPSV